MPPPLMQSSLIISHICSVALETIDFFIAVTNHLNNLDMLTSFHESNKMDLISAANSEIMDDTEPPQMGEVVKCTNSHFYIKAVTYTWD